MQPRVISFSTPSDFLYATRGVAEFLESGAKYAELVVVEGTTLYTNVAAYNINLRRIGTKEAEHTKIVVRGNRIYAVRNGK